MGNDKDWLISVDSLFYSFEAGIAMIDLSKCGAQALDSRKAKSELSLVSETCFKGQMFNNS